MSLASIGPVINTQSRILASPSGSNLVAEEATLSQILDFIGSAAQGDILYRGASGWARLAAGTSGHFLKTLGAGADPAWAASSKQFYSGNGGATNLTSGSTLYVGTARADAIESNAYLVIPVAGTWRNLYVYSSGAPGAGQTYTATFRNALADTALVATISGAGSNAASDTTHSASANAGDRYDVKFVASAGAATAAQLVWAIEFQPS